MYSSLVMYEDGSKSWYLNDQYHKTDGPAVESSNGTKYWYIHGLLHREDGPAIELPNGCKYWFLEGKEVTKELHAKLINIKMFW